MRTSTILHLHFVFPGSAIIDVIYLIHVEMQKCDKL